jgi:hypothetical protein
LSDFLFLPNLPDGNNFMNISFCASRIPCLCVVLAISAGLAGCGDGGGTVLDQTSPPNLTSADLQGRWVTDSSASTAYTVIALPDNNSSTITQAWALAQDGSGLARLAIESNSQAQGTFYSFKGSAAVAISGTVSMNSSIAPKTLSLPGLSTANTLLTQSDALSGSAVLADIAGSWNGAISGGTKTVNWTVAASGGVLAGTSSTGCVYSGSLAPVSAAKVFTVIFSESCSDGSAAGYTGVTTMSPDSKRLSTVAVANDRSKAIAFLLSR